VPSFLNVPALQLSQIATPALLLVPLLHFVQESAPSPEKNPASQNRQRPFPPGSGAYFPALQSSQAVALTGLNFPASHIWHSPAPFSSLLILPASHSKQFALFSELYFPAEQIEQDDIPMMAYFPTGHSSQPVFSALGTEPASQSLQMLWPSASAYLPVSHVQQSCCPPSLY